MIPKDINLNIVIVDNSKDDHFFLKTALGGYRNIEFTNLLNNKELLQYLLRSENYKNNKEELPAIIVLDINESELIPFDLFEILGEYERFNKTQFFVLSASDDREYQKAKNLHIRYVRKPVNLEDFRTALEDSIRSFLENKSRAF
jgi:CheY-like chemotaxis protein